ncbi:MAG: hypothetical protein R3B99_24750 [Polyangiales bacterium]
MTTKHRDDDPTPTAIARPRRRGPRGRSWALAGLLGLLGACSSGASPTLPIPPPAALTSAPDEMGVVTITGNGAIEGALVSAYNERTGRGVIETADDRGEFVLRIEGQTGDSILVWQRVGTQSGQILSLAVP